ncbi:MAG: sugar nucleotide-binding protein [Candidatus Omnitrophica bacterium]|nr:sugar nucleotide-binding protein [Candidatus Omnitrophota bacterium]
MTPRRRFLITGLNGVYGWNIYREIARHHEAYGTYRKTHPVFKKGENFFRIDWAHESEAEAILKKIRPEYFVHAWCMCDMDLCEISPEMARKVNVEGTRKILAALHQFCPDLKKFVFLSTAHVFDGEKGGYTEFDEPKPKHVFGATKRKAELLVEKCGFPSLIIRPDIVVGRSLQGDKGTPDFFIKRTKAGKPTHYFTDELRTTVKAEAMAKRMLELALSDETGVFHIGGEKVMSRYEIAVSLVKERGLPTHHIHPRLRKDDEWAHIRPKNLSLKSGRTK